MKVWRVLISLVILGGGAAVWWWLRPGDGGALSGRVGAAETLHAAADSLGYGAAFAVELQKIGQISPHEFGRRYGGKANYLPQLSWDPTTAQFWDRFNLDPNQRGAQLRLRGDEERKHRALAKSQGKPLPDDQPVMVPVAGGYDFRLNAAELVKFKQNGFVVSERMGAASCTDMYYRIYKRDLPVFISADAILHAWHRSYDAILEELETHVLMPALDEILTAMSAKVADARRDYGDGLCSASVTDADFFLAVARSLLAGVQLKSVLGQDERVRQTLQACAALQMQRYDLFGRPERWVDFSQFQPRGHYEKSEPLRQYFKAMMWCGRIDLRVAGNSEESSPRELAAAVVLADLLKRADKLERWQESDRLLQTFVGPADSMTFPQLNAVLAAGGIRSPADINDLDMLEALQVRIGAGDFGAQEIRGDVFEVNPGNPEKFVLPRSFTFLGQRFAIDSWVTAKVVFDDVRWDDQAVMRRKPSCLDVAFAVFANDHTVPMLVQRMTNSTGRKFRDGLDYQHNLAALRQVIDAQPPAKWKENLYTGWLDTLRELSQPTTDKEFPESMRTQAWAMKTLNTQLASWTQLRHDSILYVKQSYTATFVCYYPAGFVEPVPRFWERIERLVSRAADSLEKASYAQQPHLRKQHASFLRKFAVQMTTLRAIAERELVQQPLSDEQTKFLEDVVEFGHSRHGSGGKIGFRGWYPNLFYLGGEDSTKWDALVADVHTNTPAPILGDPGCVIHQGVGSVDLLMIAIDNGKDRMVYAGPVLSHYEFEMTGINRKSDSEWKNELRAGRRPPRPEWTREYLAPGVNKEVANYKTD